ncbi:MAG: aminoglycoside phosphotransferase family protein [Nitrospirae bacterium]|nr:aminoglycoside phosphotransferase family protein [Nitrospirota bacterium]
MIDISTAKRIADRFGLSLPRNVVPVSGGVINRSYILELSDGTAWICRVDVEGGGGKLAHEAAVYRWLWARAPDLPIATAYHVDPARDLIPSEYALLPRLPGANLGADVEYLPDEVCEPLLVQVGSLLRRLHALGDPDAELISHAHAHQSWRAFVEVWFEEMFTRCEARLGYAPTWAARAHSWMKERLALVPSSPKCVFLHGDFHFGNLQYLVTREPRLSGCFDLEWAWSGHAHCDLLHLQEAGTHYHAYEAPLLSGYGVTEWPPELPVYRLIHSISVLGAAIIEKPEPLWDLMAWHGKVIENVLADAPPFRDLLKPA